MVYSFFIFVPFFSNCQFFRCLYVIILPFLMCVIGFLQFSILFLPILPFLMFVILSPFFPVDHASKINYQYFHYFCIVYCLHFHCYLIQIRVLCGFIEGFHKVVVFFCYLNLRLLTFLCFSCCACSIDLLCACSMLSLHSCSMLSQYISSFITMNACSFYEDSSFSF